jgi:hypothetical protein
MVARTPYAAILPQNICASYTYVPEKIKPVLERIVVSQPTVKWKKLARQKDQIVLLNVK